MLIIYLTGLFLIWIIGFNIVEAKYSFSNFKVVYQTNIFISGAIWPFIPPVAILILICIGLYSLCTLPAKLYITRTNRK